MVEPPIVLVIQRLYQFGFFQFYLPFLISSAMFYALLRKSQIFGPPERNVATNAVVALGAAFFVWSAPILLGIDITTQLATFFLQSLGTMLVFIVGLMIAGMMFPPDLPKQLSEKIKVGWPWGLIIVAGVLIGVVVLISSGLMVALFQVGLPGLVEVTPELAWTLIIFIGMLVAFLAIIVPGG